MTPFRPASLRTYPLSARPSKVGLAEFGRPVAPGATVAGFLRSLPDILQARDFRLFVEALRRAKAGEKAVIWALGAHVIKTGLNPVIIDLMKRGWVTGLALNGAGIIHDFEIAAAGRTSEDVAAQIRLGRFGMARETGEMLNEAIRRGADRRTGLGQAVGEMIARSALPHKKHSLLAAAWRLGLPATVHVALGTDVIHLHPRASGAAIGQTSLQDFFLLAALVRDLDGGGVFLNVGSAVVLPEVFLKAVALVRNQGFRLDGFDTAVFDFFRHYRPAENVARRPLGKKGRGFYFIGPHEILIPLLAAALKGR
ncbi:MAG: hypothetical protein FJY82_15530 [Candidatus Aminicenantes bacterium]|nr:hypothetical protein [Candidatus Aminicenantes bacterium]